MPTKPRRREWWQGAVIYQIYPLSFADADGDGWGDLPGLARRLGHVADLGVDAIWISPFYASPMKDFGYDVSDHCAVDPRLGTQTDFDRVVSTAHRLGLKVLIDQIWCHTSDAHAWFRESRKDRKSGKADWYVWADARPDGTPPNNWLSVFGGSAWSWEPRRRQYYLHHFLSCQPQLDLRNEAVLESLFEIARFWLERGVDGFRLDAIDYALHDPELRDNPPRPRTEMPVKPFGLQRHVHDMIQPDTLDLLSRIRAFVDRWPGTVLLGEVSSEEGALRRSADYSGDGRLHMAYTLGVMRLPFTAPAFRDAIAEAERSKTGALCWAFSNHDVVRAVTRWGGGEGDDRLARLLMALLLSLKGSACVYQGEELGLPEARLDEADLRDPYGIAFWPEFRGRDGARTPMPWRKDRKGAVAGAARPWLPVPDAHRARAVEIQAANRHSVLASWRRFLAWRKQHPALIEGDIRTFSSPGPVLAFERRLDGEKVLAVFNLTDRAIEAPVPVGSTIKRLRGHGFPSRLAGGKLFLPPYGAFFGRIASRRVRRPKTVLARAATMREGS
jgi:alpha-glucosidase